MSGFAPVCVGTLNHVPLPLPSSDSSGTPGRSALPQPPGGGFEPPQGAPSGPPSSPGAPAPTPAACYRHPDRVGGRQCTRCGKHACPDCLTQAAVGSHCLECAKAARPDLKTRARFWSAGQPALVAYTLIAVNVAVFVGLGLYYDFGGMLSGRITEAHFYYALNEAFLDSNVPAEFSPFGTDGAQWYRLVTSGFLHYGLLHLGFNMFFLYLLGNEMEPMIGRTKFALLYVASLLGGSAGVLLIDGENAFSAGASGAVFGLLGAYAVGIWRHGINVFNTQIGSLLMINLFLTFFVRNISIGGHIGGLVAGGICGFIMLAPGYKGVPPWSKFAVPIAVALASIVISVVVASG